MEGQMTKNHTHTHKKGGGGGQRQNEICIFQKLLPARNNDGEGEGGGGEVRTVLLSWYPRRPPRFQTDPACCTSTRVYWQSSPTCSQAGYWQSKCSCLRPVRYEGRRLPTSGPKCRFREPSGSAGVCPADRKTGPWTHRVGPQPRFVKIDFPPTPTHCRSSSTCTATRSCWRR